MFGILRLSVLAIPLFFLSTFAIAHDSWISRGGLRNPAGEWCCGEGDCALLDGTAIHATPAGYVIRGYGTLQFSDPKNATREWIEDTIPFSQAQPSPDGAYWRCQRPDKSRRCFFAPPPGS
jgi:hypothetical protein